MRPVLPSRISQPFADEGDYASRDDAHGPAGHHTGIDYGSLGPVPIFHKVVRSIMNGEVVFSEHDPEIFGNGVGVSNHKNDLLVTYWHMEERHVSAGDWVLAWHDLGLVGNTGNSFGAHLHLQVNHGRTFDYHGHLDPEIAFAISPTRVEAFQRFRALKGIHPEEEKA